MRITLCGSTKFKDEFVLANKILSKQGHVVYSVSCFGHAGDVLTDEEKVTLDKVHKAKIDNSDAIFVLDCGGYIGESTRSEIAHAEATGKAVFYLSKQPSLNGISVPVDEVRFPEPACPYCGRNQPCEGSYPEGCFCEEPGKQNLWDEKTILRPTSISIMGRNSGGFRIISDDDQATILEFKQENSVLPEGQVREFARYLIEYYNQNYS